MKSHDVVIACLILSIAAFGLASFFWEPKYLKGEEVIIEALVNSLAMVLAYKFTAHVPKPESLSTPPATPVKDPNV